MEDITFIKIRHLKVENHGDINVNNSGHAALLGNYVTNEGVITARYGKIFMGAGEQITLDLSGRGLMNIP